jgi:hypothetical protein
MIVKPPQIIPHHAERTHDADPDGNLRGVFAFIGVTNPEFNIAAAPLSS